MERNESDEFKKKVDEFKELHKKYNDSNTEMNRLAFKLREKVFPISFSGYLVIFSSYDKCVEFEDELNKRSIEGLIPRIPFTVRKGSFLPYGTKHPRDRLQNGDLYNIDKITVDMFIDHFYEKYHPERDEENGKDKDDDEEDEDDEDEIPTNESQ
jgi:hypothetical protein